MTEPHDNYDAVDDVWKSVAFAYQHIRERVARGGPGWRGWPADLEDRARKAASQTEGETSMRNVQYYGNILEALRQNSTPVHIAGGAVRDTILGRQIRDIDIFLGDAHGDDAAALLRSTFGYVKTGEWKRYEMFSDPMVARVAKFEKADETIPLCLIGLKEELTPRENVERFDFGLCMAWWDGKNITTTDQFKRDAEAKTFTLCRADNNSQFAYSMIRFKKLAADRYRDFTLSVPNQFEDLAKEHAFRQHWYRESGYHFGIENQPQTLRPKER
jgi:Poly A polymerase head domain